MFCQNCGGSVSEGDSFCTRCGHHLPKPPVRVSEHQLRHAREALQESIAQRSRTDTEISPLWVIVPLVIMVTTTAVTVALIVMSLSDAFDDWDSTSGDPLEYDPTWGTEFAIIQLAAMIGTLILTKLAYDLVSREQRHFRRERKIADALAPLVSSSTGGPIYWRPPAGAEATRKPLFWAIIVIAPSAVSLVTTEVFFDLRQTTHVIMTLWLGLTALACYILLLYMLHFLTKEMIGHHDRWYNITVHAKRELARMGYTAGHLRTPELLPDRNSAVYVIATIFTVGLFMYYWWYAIIKDGNVHFDEQRLFEDGLLELLDKRPTAPDQTLRTPQVTASV